MKRKNWEVKDRETREREIQAAAKEVFYSAGYDAASMEAIAKKANIAKGTIYLYYQNKGDLYISLMTGGTARINENLALLDDRLIRGKISSGREIIMGILECFYKEYRNDPDNVRIVAMFQQGDIFKHISPETVEKLNHLARRNNIAMRRILSLGKTQGLLGAQTNELVLPDILWALFTGVLQVEESRKRITGDDFVEHTLTHAFELLSQSLSVENGASSDEPSVEDPTPPSPGESN